MNLKGVTPQWVRWMFTRIARRYDFTNLVISAGLDHYWRRRLAQHIGSTPAGHILDVACGTGRVMIQVAQRSSASTRLFGLDFTEAMLRVGRTRLAKARLPSRAHLCAGDAMALPFGDNRFDVVTIMFGVRNFDDPLVGLRECYRVLRPGGRLYVVEFTWPRAVWVRLLYSGYFRYILPLIAWPLAGEWTAYRYLRDSVLAFRQQPGLDSLLYRLGFTGVRSTPLSGGITTLYEGCK